jgi:putative spermidine/putrescine transport system substrate-binding protein
LIREIIAGVLLATACVASAGAQSPPKEFAGQTLKVAIFGGTWQQWQQKVIEPKFTELTGAKVEYTPGAPGLFLSALVAAKGQNVPFDVTPMSEDLFPEANRQGLLIPGTEYDKSLIPNADKTFEEIRPNQVHGPSDFISLNGVLYDAAKFKENGLAPPNDWAVLNDPKLAGHIAVPDITFVYRIIYANINNWKTGDPYNLDGALEWLKAIKDPIIYADFPTLQTRFNSGDIWVVLGSAGYVLRFRAQGKEMEFLVPDSRGTKIGTTFSSLNIVKGTSKFRLAQMWINLTMSDEIQTAMVEDIGFAASSKVVTEKLRQDPNLTKLVVQDDAEMRVISQTDWAKMGAVLPQWIDKWNRSVRR